jgi:hypothetical protein
MMARPRTGYAHNIADAPSVVAGFATPTPRDHALMLLEHTRRRFGLGALHDASRRRGPVRPRTGYQAGGEVEDDDAPQPVSYPPDAGGDFTDAGTPPGPQPVATDAGTPVQTPVENIGRLRRRAREQPPQDIPLDDAGMSRLLIEAGRKGLTSGIESAARGIGSAVGAVSDEWGHLKDNLRSYIRGDNAGPKQELDATRAQIQAANQDLTPAQVNETMVSDQNVPVDKRADQLAGMRKEYDGLRAIAQGALAHGAVGEAAQIIEHALNHLPDGSRYSIKQDEDGRINVNGTPMSRQQFTDFVGGAATGFDHLMENGADKNIEIASRATPAGPRELAPETTGYQAGQQAAQRADGIVPFSEGELPRGTGRYYSGYRLRGDGSPEPVLTPEGEAKAQEVRAGLGRSDYAVAQQPAAPGQEGVRPGYKRVYPKTVEVLTGSGDRRAYKIQSDTPAGPNDPFYQHPGFEVPDPNYKPPAGQAAPTNAPAALPKLQSSDPNAGPGRYDENGVWTGFSGVPGMPHYASQEAHRARSPGHTGSSSAQALQAVGGSRSVSESRGARGGGSASIHEVYGVPKEYGFNPTTGYGELFNREAFEKAALEHNSAKATAAADKTAQLAAHDVVESLSKDKQQIYQTAREKIKAQTPLDDDEADVLRLVAQQTAAKLRGQPATSAPPATPAPRQTPAQGGGGGGNYPTPSPASVQALKSDPRMRATFESYYGPGSAARVLGQ